MIGASLVGSLLTGKVLAIAAAAACAAVLAAGVGGYLRGHSVGVDDDKQRSDLVITKLQVDAANKLADANKLIKLQSDALQAQKDKADRDLHTERQLNARRIADRAATDLLVRDQLIAFASGPGPAADTVAACRSDASALGDVLDRSLRAHEVCSGAAEAESAGARALLAAWPTKSPLAASAPTH